MTNYIWHGQNVTFDTQRKACILCDIKLYMPEVHVSPPVMILLEGLIFVAVVGALSLFRREGLSLQFALEAMAGMAILSGLAAFTAWQVNPILPLVLVYLVTMRVRLLVDLGTLLAERGRFAQADRCLALAKRLWPDSTGRLMIQVNQGVACLQRKLLDEAITIFKSVLNQAGQGYLGIKYESAAHYNLGVAYRRKNMEAQAITEFNAVLDTWPASVYARHAQMALESSRHKDKPQPPAQDTPKP